MKNYPRLIPLWFIALLALVAFWIVTCQTGCRTGGKWLNPNSAGTIIHPSKKSTRERVPPPKITQPVEPAPPIVSAPQSPPVVNNTPVKSAPVSPKPTSAKANPVEITPAPAKLEPFSPTISPTPTVNVRPLLPEETGKVESPVTPIENEAAPKEKSTSNWLGLFSFYTVCLLGMIILWVIYDIIKDSIQMRKQGSPIKDHLENLKKPAKGTRGGRKRATNKKKTTKKKSTRKKKS